MSHPAIPDKMPAGARYTLAQSSNFLPITALLYDTWRTRSLSLLTRDHFPLERELALMLEWLEVKPGARYLDVGTSTGNYARALSDAGATVTAIDISLPMLKSAARQSAPRPIRFERANVEALPYPDGSFDGVVVGASLNEFHDTELALREMARVLAPEGKLFLMYLCEAEGALGRLTQLPFKLSGVRFPARQTLQDNLLALGLRRRRAEIRRAVTLELFVKTSDPNPETQFQESLKASRPLSRAAGKPARDPLE